MKVFNYLINDNIFQQSGMQIQSHCDLMWNMQMSNRYFSLLNYKFQIVLNSVNRNGWGEHLCPILHPYAATYIEP